MTKQNPISEADWKAAGVERYGADTSKWRFRCPACDHVAAVSDWKAAGAPEGAVAFSCVGRYRGAPGQAFEKQKRQPCNYAGGGLFRLNPVQVQSSAGVHQVFDFADRPLVEAAA